MYSELFTDDENIPVYDYMSWDLPGYRSSGVRTPKNKNKNLGPRPKSKPVPRKY